MYTAKLVASLGVALTVLLMGHSVSSADSFQSQTASPKKGLKLAESLCSNCHIVSDGASNPVTVGVPSFKAIANDPNNTPELIAGSIIIPHPPMPTIQLDLSEIRDIVAYIHTLKTE